MASEEVQAEARAFAELWVSPWRTDTVPLGEGVAKLTGLFNDLQAQIAVLEDRIAALEAGRG